MPAPDEILSICGAPAVHPPGMRQWPTLSGQSLPQRTGARLCEAVHCFERSHNSQISPLLGYSLLRFHPKLHIEQKSLIMDSMEVERCRMLRSWLSDDRIQDDFLQSLRTGRGTFLQSNLELRGSDRWICPDSRALSSALSRIELC